jgi:hypothetical protein
LQVTENLGLTNHPKDVQHFLTNHPKDVRHILANRPKDDWFNRSAGAEFVAGVKVAFYV